MRSTSKKQRIYTGIGLLCYVAYIQKFSDIYVQPGVTMNPWKVAALVLQSEYAEITLFACYNIHTVLETFQLEVTEIYDVYMTSCANLLKRVCFTWIE
jgi:hypothetical protein